VCSLASGFSIPSSFGVQNCWSFDYDIIFPETAPEERKAHRRSCAMIVSGVSSLSSFSGVG